MNIDRDLLQFYRYKGIIKENDIETILSNASAQNQTVGEYMLANEYTSESLDLEPLSEFYCIPATEVDLLKVDKALFEKFTLDAMKKNKFLPVKLTDDGVLLVAVADPLDCNVMSCIASEFVGDVDVVLVSPSKIDRYIDSALAAESTSSALNELNSEKDKGNTTAIENEESEDVLNNPAVRLVDSIIKEAVPAKASDIHIEPFEKNVRVRYRIDGDLQERADIPIESFPAICARMKILSGMDIAERRIPQDGRINLSVGGKEYDFRVSSLPTVYGEKFVIRILDKTAFRFKRQDLGFTDKENKVIDKLLAAPHGIILLTGPTGCGKSTTLYSFLKEVNDPTVNIVTVENPVEYTLNGINQTQVNVKANMTFASALRSILRQDPDIIMIGEIRDEETAQIAVRAANTGHLVFSTLHTNDAPSAVIRLEDMGVADYLIADALIGVIAQRLIKKLCPVCRKKIKTTAKEMRILGLSQPAYIYAPQGCQFCNNTGYKGRIGIHEVMHLNADMRNLIMRNRNNEALKECATKNGMVSLWDSCRDLVLEGVTGISELMTLDIE